MAKVRWLIENWDIYYFGQAPKHMNGVALNADKIEFRNPWETFQLVARAVPQWAIEQTDFTWASSNTSIATVNSNWLVTCVTPWSCTITVTTTFWWFTATCNVTKVPSFVDFLLVWAWGWWWASYSSARPWWWGWAWWFVECFNYCVAAGTYQVMVWCRWGGGCSWCRGASGGLSCFNWICADWWGGWWGNNLPGANVSWNSWWWGWWACRWAGGTSVLWHKWWTAGTCGWGWWGWANCDWNGGWSRVWWMWWDGKCSCITWSCVWYAWGWWGGSCGYCSHWAWWQWSTNCWWWWQWWQNTNDGDPWRNWLFILRYPTACWYSITWWTKYTCWDYTIHCFTSNGTLVAD